MKKILLFILLFISICSAQTGAGYKTIRWSDLSKAVKDSIRTGGTGLETGTVLEWNIIAPTISYGHGDSLLFVKSNLDENIYYNLGQIFSAMAGFDVVVDSLWLLVKGDALSYVDSIKIYTVVDDSLDNLSVKYTYNTPIQCTGSNQTNKYTINVVSVASQPFLLRIWYDVTQYVYTTSFRIFGKLQ
jgi:hypothetical protein